jgi:hypothetical protein
MSFAIIFRPFSKPNILLAEFGRKVTNRKLAKT